MQPEGGRPGEVIAIDEDRQIRSLDLTAIDRVEDPRFVVLRTGEKAEVTFLKVQGDRSVAQMFAR